MIDLGEAEPIERLIAGFRTRVTRDPDEWRGVVIDEDSAEAADERLGEALRSKLFDPLREALDTSHRLFLAPDGELTRLPFEILPLDEGRHLFDEYPISYLGVGRDALRFQTEVSRSNTEPLVVADPDFDLSGKPVSAQREALPLGHQARDLDRAGLHFPPLPGTRIEGERIAAMLGVQPCLGAAALEAPIKAHRSPRLLHLATHGFFLKDTKHDLNRDIHDAGPMSLGLADGTARLAGVDVENPLLRSGLALAGINTWLKHGALPAAAEDGVLTAEDVSGLDLLGTELVVLSACETGLGEVQVGEGVFGLRRAFLLAGAKTSIMSLWKVPDLATAILMERLYDNLLNHRRPRDEALHEAQRYVRDLTLGEIRPRWLTAEMIEQLSVGSAKTQRHLAALAGQPDRYRPFRDSLYWGAFICQGDPSPLLA